MRDPEFLSWEIIENLHAESLRRFGGSAGVRDKGQIRSALVRRNLHGNTAAPNSMSPLLTLFTSLRARRSLMGTSERHVAAALLFLAGYGYPRFVDDGRLYAAMIAIAERKLNKAGLAALLKEFVSSN